VKIDKVELRALEMPLVHAFQTSFGVEYVRKTVLVTVFSQGLEGWGECPVSAFPGYAYETVDTALHVLGDFLLPGLAGSQVKEPAAGMPEAFGRVRGHPMARAGVEAALFDLFARSKGIPLSQMYGGVQNAVPVGVSVGIQPSIDEILDRIGRFVEMGYSRVKIKIRPGWDRDVVSAVRERFSDLPLWVDANQAYGPSDMDFLASFDSLGLGLVEQPFGQDDLVSHGRLAERMKTPVCLDESVGSLGHFASARALGAVGVLNIKAARVGGYAAARALHDSALASGIPVWCGGLLETGIGRLHNLALASGENFTLPGDISASDRYFERDVIDPPVSLAPGGVLVVPTAPGLGHDIDRHALDAFTIRCAEFY
jgi:O-succinylbenzoate synthase